MAASPTNPYAQAGVDTAAGDLAVELMKASVRATHAFLTDAEITALRGEVRRVYLYGVELRVLVDADGAIDGFVGVAEGKVEMLFLDPSVRRRGIGRALLTHACEVMGADTVDVNEENPDARAFYARMGFEVVGRSPLDDQGRPHPLLHLRRRSCA